MSKVINPFENRDLHTRLLFPTLSWSSYSAFTTSYPGQDRHSWFEKYVRGIRSKPNAAMKAGQVIGERLATDPDYLPDVPKPEIYEQELFADFAGLKLTGHLDGWSPSIKRLDEFKTNASCSSWSPKKVHNHHQLTFYALLLYLNFQIIPDDLSIFLTSIPVTEDHRFKLDVDLTRKIRTFETKRTLNQVLMFGAELKKTFAEMQLFVKEKENGNNI